MEDNFILISIIVVIVINFVIYYFIRNRKEERELRDYFKKDMRKNKKEKTQQH
ncbi:hypothetical protein [Flavobacterium terrisoli]|uniref:hypothetical protein n=1 Tax=Flavobacterium terrisoli TaxID=3242195 RepID=UPI002542D78C|nr:hypothetical protein [Flavobacterium buctense]